MESDISPTLRVRSDFDLINAGGAGGYIPRDWNAAPLGYCASVFDLTPIPKSEWIDRIIEREKLGITNRAIAARFGIKPLHQGQTRYCWINAVVDALNRLRVKTLGEVKLFSPASAGARIKGFQNIGGHCTEGVKWIRQHGLNYQADWPANAIDRKYDTAENRAKAKQHIITEWLDFPVHGVSREDRGALQMTALLNGYTVPAGYNWWRHAITVMDPVINKGQIMWLCANSGLGRDANGETLLSWNQGIYDDAVAPVVMTPSEIA